MTREALADGEPGRAPWLAIDPNGKTGDPGYDAGPFLLTRNLNGAERKPAVLRRRLDILAHELDYDRARLRDGASPMPSSQPAGAPKTKATAGKQRSPRRRR